MDRVADSTNQSVSFAAFTTATGAAVTVTSATAGLSLWYRRGNVGAKTAITPSNLAAINSVHADGGLIVIEAQDHRLDLPDAAFAAGVDYLEWGGSATGITIDGGSCNLIGQPTTGSVGTPLTSEQTKSAAAAAIAAAGIATEAKQDEILADIAAIVPAGGIYTQTVTVKTTGGAAIPNATVAIYSGSVLIDTKTTNSSGIAQPMCDAGSYTLRVTATGYTSYSASLTVTGDATLADIVLSSSETTITPSADQAKTTAYWIVYGADTMPVGEDDVTATIWIIKMPSDHGAAYVDNPVQTISTTTNGILSATLFKGATYQIALSDGREWVVEVPLKAGTTYKMPPIRVAEA